jgi:putative component of membrane protein insertase Oxa1/YidC/SpoIIIJ protein YidD
MITTIDSSIRGPLILAIDWYRHVISPRKGFECPHRLRHGGDSCSLFARRTLESHCVWPGIGLVITRLDQCAQAARELATERRHAGHSRVRDEYFDPVPPAAKGEPPAPVQELSCDYVADQCRSGACCPGIVPGCIVPLALSALGAIVATLWEVVLSLWNG